MPTFADSRLPKPSSWDEFEKIVLSVAKIRWDSPDFTRHGRQGQAQQGVDVYGKDTRDTAIGIQCKNTVGGVTRATVLAELDEADQFKPTLAKLYIATTADADASTQAMVRDISEARRAEGKFEVNILFWGDIWDDLTRDESRLHQHFPQLKPLVVTRAAPEGPTHDQRLFEQFKTELAYEPAIRLLTEQDFAGAFRHEFIQPLFSFVNTWGTPEFEFIDPELQDALENFYADASEMASCIAMRTVPVGNGSVRSVYSDQQRASGPRDQHVKREAQEMNNAAEMFVPKYAAFLRLCRSKLAS